MERFRAMRWLVLATVALISVQLLLIVVQGEAACFNEGCRVVEGLTRVSPFWFNLVGLTYFATLYAVLVWMPGANGGGALLQLLLAAGLGAEGVLLAYQMVVAQTFCGYCLIIFSSVLSLNLLLGLRPAAVCLAGLAGILAIFPLLRFGPGVAAARRLTLASGTYGTLRAAPATHELYLFFSETCEHCRTVVRHIPNPGRCTVHFNPIGRLAADPVAGLEKTAGHFPEVNRALLAFLDIGDIPVLVERSAETLRILKGERAIMAFLADACAPDEPLPAPASVPPLPSVPDEASQEGECSVNLEDCPAVQGEQN